MLERLFSERIGVLVQGITGRAGRQHAALMRAYGTNIVGGVSSSGAGTSVDGVPVFADCRCAVAATGRPRDGVLGLCVVALGITAFAFASRRRRG